MHCIPLNYFDTSKWKLLCNFSFEFTSLHVQSNNIETPRRIQFDITPEISERNCMKIFLYLRNFILWIEYSEFPILVLVHFPVIWWIHATADAISANTSSITWTMRTVSKVVGQLLAPTNHLLHVSSPLRYKALTFPMVFFASHKNSHYIYNAIQMVSWPQMIVLMDQVRLRKLRMIEPLQDLLTSVFSRWLMKLFFLQYFK